MQVTPEFLHRHQIEPQRIAVGVSGGADSLSCILMLHEQNPSYQFIALTVDHGLRPTSRQEAEYVASIMQQNGIEHHILEWKGRKPKTGIEEKARQARYNLMYDWCCRQQVKYLVLAHHLYDQAETFLMRLERGSGAYGLSSMQEVTPFKDIYLLRPLLKIRPEELKSYLNQKGLTWVEDESNQCTDFLRVRMRKFLPELEQKSGITPERLSLAIENIQQTRNFIAAVVAEKITAKVHFWSSVACSFDYQEFLSWHDELKFYVLRELIQRLGRQDYTPDSSSLKMQLQRLVAGESSSFTLGHVYIEKSDHRLWLIRETRHNLAAIREQDWQLYENNHPVVRGIKLPYKLRQALFYEKSEQK